MDEHDFNDRLDLKIRQYIRFKSHQLVGTYGFLRDDIEDIQQELVLDYLRRSRGFNWRRCHRRTFARLTINHRIATLAESRTASCRDYRRCTASLDAPVPMDDGERFVLADVITGARESDVFQPHEARWQLEIDIARMVALLPGHLSRICRLLLRGGNVESVVREARISRATLYRRLKQIRPFFEEAGLNKYLT